MTTPQKGNSGVSAKGSPGPKSGQAMTKATRTMRVQPTDHAAPNNAIITHRARAAAQRRAQRAMLQDSVKNGGNAVKKLGGTAVQAIKAAGRGVASAVSSLLTAGGGAVVLVLFLTVILVAAIVASPFGILFSNESREAGVVPISAAVTQINYDFNAEMEALQTAENYDPISVTGRPADWIEVLAVFAVKVAGADADAADVATMDADRIARLKAVFWDMTTITHRVEIIHHPGSGEGDDGWTLVFLSSYHDNMKSILLIWILAAILGVLTIIAGCLFFRKNSQKTTIVLNSILSAMESASNGNLDIHIPEELMARNDFYVADEFTMIGEHLNEMIHQLDLYIQRSYKNEIQRQEAEYRALQSQINPHFLYNTLNCFVSLNRLGMKKELEAGILQLTHIFRYTCSNSKTTTVAQELQFCTQYCELMKLRFDERITYVCECAEATREIEIPRLLIQPFVENAMKHGMDPDGRSITIWTAACIDHGTLVLSIKNNGIPIDLDTLRASEHVGIMNVENRLKIFDPDARLDITLEDGITSFTVYIPMKGGGTTDISAE